MLTVVPEAAAAAAAARPSFVYVFVCGRSPRVTKCALSLDILCWSSADIFTIVL